MTSLSAWSSKWSDIASILGLLVGVVGFAVTIAGVWRSKTAAEKAEAAANRARDALLRTDTVADFASAMSIMEEIKRLQREQAWGILPDRYSILRRKLISIGASNPGLSESHRTSLQAAIQHFAAIEQQIERSLATSASSPSVPRINEIVSAQIDRLEEVITTIRSQIEV